MAGSLFLSQPIRTTAKCRATNAETNEEILRYSEDFGAFTTFTLADLKRVDGGWSFTAIGEGSNLELQDYVNAL